MDKQIMLQDLLVNQLSIPIKLLTNYHKLGLNETDVMVIIQIHRFIVKGDTFPTPDDLSSCTTLNKTECSHILRKLIQRQFLSINQIENEKHQLSERYSLEPLWNKLFTVDEDEQEKPDEGNLFILFEQEFGRPLSPFEIEMISSWLDDDGIVPALIKAALREAVLMGKLNFKYIDRILRNWNKKGIKTVEEARELSRSFRGNQQPPKQTSYNKNEEKDDSLYFNWLTGED